MIQALLMAGDGRCGVRTASSHVFVARVFCTFRLPFSLLIGTGRFAQFCTSLFFNSMCLLGWML